MSNDIGLEIAPCFFVPLKELKEIERREFDSSPLRNPRMSAMDLKNMVWRYKLPLGGVRGRERKFGLREFILFRSFVRIKKALSNSMAVAAAVKIAESLAMTGCYTFAIELSAGNVMPINSGATDEELAAEIGPDWLRIDMSKDAAEYRRIAPSSRIVTVLRD